MIKKERRQLFEFTDGIKNIYVDVKNNNFFAILTFATFFCFIIFLTFIYFFTTLKSPAAMFFSVVPTLISGIIYYISKRGTIKERIENWLRPLLISGVLIFSIGNFFFLVWIEFFEEFEIPINDSTQYERIITEFRTSSNGLNIFPKKIPKDATNISFHSRASAEFLQLSFNAPSELIEKYKKQYENDVQYIFQLNKENRQKYNHIIPYWIIVTDKFNPKWSISMDKFILGHVPYEERYTSIPDGYMIYIVDSELSFSLNHGKYYGLAINPQNDHIIFFSEYW